LSALAAEADRSDVERLSRRNFDRLARFIYEYSGIKMPPTKLTMLEGRLRRRLRATGIEGLDAYCSYLFDQSGLEHEAIHLIGVVTTNKTDFFREPQHFEFLRDVALPDLAGAGHRQLRVWSSACSSGAEPYTLAMVLEEFFGPAGSPYVILATDLSTDMLGVAHRGVYPRQMLSPVPTAMRRRHVMESREAQRGEVRINARLRSKIGFGRLNLMDERYAVGDAMHVIFCRNVLIYFDKPTQARVLSRLCDRLTPGGYLFIGHSESISGIDLPLRQVSNTIFQRV
jgi:chemotaxis protein methyltransferase CheR